MEIINKSNPKIYWQEKETLVHWSGSINWCNITGNSMVVSLKTEHKGIIWPSYTTLGHIRKELNTHQKYLHSYVYSYINHSSQEIESASVPIFHLWVKIKIHNNGVLYICREKLSSDVCRNVDQMEMVMWNTPDSDTYCELSLMQILCVCVLRLDR